MCYHLIDLPDHKPSLKVLESFFIILYFSIKFMSLDNSREVDFHQWVTVKGKDWVLYVKDAQNLYCFLRFLAVL